LKFNVDNLLKIQNKNIIITGNAKNAGKTTLFKYLVYNFRKNHELCLMSIGIDGEKIDNLYSYVKPTIYVQPNDYVLTTINSLKLANLQYKIIDILEIKTILGYLVVAKIIDEGEIEIIGPEHNEQLLQIIKKNYLNGKNIIDGAINRLSHVACITNSCIFDNIYIKNNDNLVIDRLLMWELNEILPILNNNDENNCFINKIITMDVFMNMKNQIKQFGIKFVIPDLSFVFIQFSIFKQICENIILINRINIVGIFFRHDNAFVKDFLIKAKVKKIIHKVFINPYLN